MGNKYKDIRYKWLSERGFNVLKDEYQHAYVKSLWETPENIQLVSVDAPAGTGKTALAVLCGAYAVENEEYDRILYIRNAVPIRDVGFLPGDKEDKLSPFFEPLIDAMDKIKPGTFEVWKEKGLVHATSTSFLRGVNFERMFIIIDEAQNITLHELRTILTRIHNNSKVVLIGSHLQVDTPKLERIAGLTPFEVYIEHFKGKKAVNHILMTNYRGEFSQHADRIEETIKRLKEISK